MELLIWGCGRFGRLAYHYYNEQCNIVGFVDSDADKWGMSILGKNVYSPKILKTFHGNVIIAIKRNYQDIVNEIKQLNATVEITIFKIEEQILNNEINPGIQHITDENTIMVYFSGGIGNQMFQYALAKNYLEQGKRVLFNIENYFFPGKRKFILNDVFKNIMLHFGNDAQKKEIIKKNADIFGSTKNFRIYTEDTSKNTRYADMSMLDITGGIIWGFHQNYRFAQNVEKELREDFTFGTNNDEKLIKILSMVQKTEAVSVHIRRGDYLAESNWCIYGDICTIQYYKNAMRMIESSVKPCVFYFFSNDMDWVKEQFRISNAVYIESNMFEDYQDWYDMFLMSQCKHNIIANSTFSWWGAWLNQNPGKFVIAPKKWINTCDYMDIYPKNWITI